MENERAEILTMVACPPPDTEGAGDNLFIDKVLATLASRPAHRNRVYRVASVRDLDLALGAALTERNVRPRVQIIGHGISGVLALGALWIPDDQIQSRAFRFPHYVLDTNPSALGLLSKHAGKLSELMLVSCQIGAAAAYGYAINGRTLTYTLAELLRCTVLGADDVVGPSELDAHGWYMPAPGRRSAKGWRWNDGAPPCWIERVAPSPPARRAHVA